MRQLSKQNRVSNKRTTNDKAARDELAPRVPMQAGEDASITAAQVDEARMAAEFASLTAQHAQDEYLDLRSRLALEENVARKLARDRNEARWPWKTP